MRSIPDNNFAYPIRLFGDMISGTAFILLTKNDELFLITAKHVLFDDNKLRGKTAEIHCPSGDISDDSVHIFSIDFEKTIPIPHKDSDVCATFLGKKGDKIAGGSYNEILTDGVEILEKGSSALVVVDFKHTKKLQQVLISNNSFIYGYPTSLGLNHRNDYDFNKPLLRKGVISNLYPKNYTIILDCRTDYGNSGGPVIEVSYDEKGDMHKVIGVVSKFLTLKNEWINTRDKTPHIENINAGYTVVVSMDKVFDLTDNYKPLTINS